MAEIKLTKMSKEVFDYVKGNGGKVSIDELANATGRNSRSVGANVTDLKKKGLADRVKEKGADNKEVTYVQLTDEGMAFIPAED